MVEKPATMGSTSGKSTAPAMTTSARPVSMSRAPMAIEVLPVAQAVTVVMHGPVAPENMEILPAIMFTQELGFM